MPSEDIQLCSASRARPDIARKVLRAFPAPRRQLRRRCPCSVRPRMEAFATVKSNQHSVKNFACAVQPGVQRLWCGRTALEGASALQSLSRNGRLFTLTAKPRTAYTAVTSVPQTALSLRCSDL
jgi:hypothetical protein